MDREQFPKCPHCINGRMSASGDGSNWCDRCEVPAAVWAVHNTANGLAGNAQAADVIGGFPIVQSICLGCGKTLLLENAWMADGCPCNSVLGINSMNETRWRLLMQLQQSQAIENESIKGELAHMRTTDAVQDRQALLENVTALEVLLKRVAAECREPTRWPLRGGRDMRGSR